MDEYAPIAHQSTVRKTGHHESAARFDRLSRAGDRGSSISGIHPIP